MATDWVCQKNWFTDSHSWAPGLAVRVIGEITKEKLDMLREADAIFREEIEKENGEETPNQYFAVLTDLRSVGVERRCSNIRTHSSAQSCYHR